MMRQKIERPGRKASAWPAAQSLQEPPQPEWGSHVPSSGRGRQSEFGPFSTGYRTQGKALRLSKRTPTKIKLAKPNFLLINFTGWNGTSQADPQVSVNDQNMLSSPESPLWKDVTAMPQGRVSSDSSSGFEVLTGISGESPGSQL